MALARTGPNAWSIIASVDDGGALEASVEGRAVIALSDATMLVPDGWRGTALPLGGWFLERMR